MGLFERARYIASENVRKLTGAGFSAASSRQRLLELERMRAELRLNLRECVREAEASEGRRHELATACGAADAALRAHALQEAELGAQRLTARRAALEEALAAIVEQVRELRGRRRRLAQAGAAPEAEEGTPSPSVEGEGEPTERERRSS
jgi:chromosome segregation ATPase